jgi:hypothetical protein
MLERRNEPRVRAALWVDVSGTDAQREPFSQRVIAINLSLNGGLLWGVEAELRSGDVITVSYLERKALFQVVWVLEESAVGAQVALHRLAEQPCPWGEALPAATAAGD